MKKIYLIASLALGISAGAQNANVALSNLSNNNGYSGYNSSSKNITGIFFEILSDGNNSNNQLDDFETSLYLLPCDASGNATGSTPIIIKTYNITGMYQMSARDYSNESVDLSQVSGLSDGNYRLGVWVNSDIGIPQPPDDGSDNAALIKSDAGTTAGSVIAFTKSGTPTGLVNPGLNVSIDVFPNPASSQVTFTNVKGGLVTIKDAAGKIVEKLSADTETIVIDMHAYEAGVYFYQVQSASGSASGKLIRN